MTYIVQVSEAAFHHRVDQDEALQMARTLFQSNDTRTERLFRVFENSQIQSRQLAMPISWYKQEHSFKEKNDTYIQKATEYGVEAVKKCMQDINANMVNNKLTLKHIEAIFFISTTGISTPSIDVHIMNELEMNVHAKRIPIWGLGCAGGVSGLARAAEYCLAYPQANVLVVCLELCSLTFQLQDNSKSNVVGASLFADGAACALVCGDESSVLMNRNKQDLPAFIKHQTTLLPDSTEIMGWDLRDEGLFVIFSKHIPTMIDHWVYPNADEFLRNQLVSWKDIDYFIAHPGGKKILDGYEQSLPIQAEMTEVSREILRKFGNMSSVTVLCVLQETMKQHINLKVGEQKIGLMSALGPGFSSELMLLRWGANE